LFVSRNDPWYASSAPASASERDASRAFGSFIPSPKLDELKRVDFPPAFSKRTRATTSSSSSTEGDAPEAYGRVGVVGTDDSERVLLRAFDFSEKASVTFWSNPRAP
jgi:hypothetical protein